MYEIILSLRISRLFNKLEIVSKLDVNVLKVIV